jgi:hypothetical protein
VEDLIGWHFNQPARGKPTSYASAEQYRDQFRRKGLLAELVDHGRLPAAKPAPPAVRPDARLILPNVEPTRDGGAVVVAPPSNVQLMLLNIPGELADEINLLVDGRQAGVFRRTAPDAWEADLGATDWRPGAAKQLMARMTRREDPPQTFDATLAVRYVPPLAHIELGSSHYTTTKATWDFGATLAPAVADERFAYQVKHQFGDRETVLVESISDQPVTLDLPLDLQEGSNRIVVGICSRKSVWC